MTRRLNHTIDICFRRVLECVPLGQELTAAKRLDDLIEAVRFEYGSTPPSGRATCTCCVEHSTCRLHGEEDAA